MCTNGFFLKMSRSLNLTLEITMGMCDEPVCYEEVAITCVAELEVEVNTVLAAAAVAAAAPMPMPGGLDVMVLWASVCG